VYWLYCGGRCPKAVIRHADDTVEALTERNKHRYGISTSTRYLATFYIMFIVNSMTRHRDIQIIYICQYSVHAVGSSLEASLQVVLARSASCGARPRPSRYSCVVVVLVVCCKSSLTNGNAPQKADVALLAGCPFDSFEYTSTAHASSPAAPAPHAAQGDIHALHR
jgi:hypothetical protein